MSQPPSEDAGQAFVDEDQFEELSRSMSASAAMVPEPIIGIPADRRLSSSSRRHQSPLLHPEDQTSTSQQPHNETTPLLNGSQNNGHGDEGPRDVKTSTTPYLNNTSPTRFWLIFSQLSIATFIAVFDSTIMSSSHPVITSYFHAANMAAWLSTVYQLAFAVVQPLVGRLSDALGRKPIFLGGMSLFCVSTLWCAVAGSMQSFVLARAIGGLGAGAAMTCSAIIISDLVPIELRSSFQAYMNIIYGSAATSGVALGGVMAENLGWRWEFGVQIPVILLSIGLSWVAIPAELGLQTGRKTLREAMGEFDHLGSFLLTTFISFMILGLNFGGNYLPWSHPFVITSLAICVAVLPLFIWQESRASLPIFPLKLATETPRANIIWFSLILTIIANGAIFNLPLYFQAVLLTSASTSGLRLALPSIVSSTAAVVVSFGITYYRRVKWPIVSGAALLTIGLICLASLTPNLPAILYHLVLLPHSIGAGFAFPSSFIAILVSSTQAEQGVVTSALLLFRSIGMVLGVALSSLAVQNGLIWYLDEYVQGEKRDEIIRLARESVEAVKHFEEPYRGQVIHAYDSTLKLTFASLAAIAVVGLLLVSPMKLKRLPLKSK